MTPDRLLVMLCMTVGFQTFSIGAFPALLPEVGRSAALADWQLGAVAGAFGFARMLADVPAGLFMTYHVRRALVAAPVFLLVGAACLVAGGGFGWMLLGRALMGTGHTLGMLGALTILLQARAERGLASALGAFELAAMLGMLGGVSIVGALPLSWQAAYLVACSPVLLGILTVRAALALLPPAERGARPWFARSVAARAGGADRPTDRVGTALAFAAGGAVALAYSTTDQFVLPVRGSREFGLERAGIARLLMIAQTCDALALLPLGALADRRGTAPVLAVVLCSFAVGIALIGLGPLPLVWIGCVVFGLSMAGWMLPVGLLRAATPRGQVAWRTALFRVVVDGGLSLGPFLSGLLGAAHARVLPGALAVLLVSMGVLVLARAVRARSQAAKTLGAC
jgi:MFS family permease